MFKPPEQVQSTVKAAQNTINVQVPVWNGLQHYNVGGVTNAQK